MLDPPDRASDEKELAFLSRDPPEIVRPPVWERSLRPTRLYFGPSDYPELIEPSEVAKPSFMEKVQTTRSLSTADHSIIDQSVKHHAPEMERYTDLLNCNLDQSYAQTLVFCRQQDIRDQFMKSKLSVVETEGELCQQKLKMRQAEVKVRDREMIVPLEERKFLQARLQAHE